MYNTQFTSIAQRLCYNNSTCQTPTHVNLPIPHMVTMPPSAMPVALCETDITAVNCILYIVR